MRNIAILGGTFDPIHLGHLAIAKNIQNFFNFQEFFFLPSNKSVHKGNITDPNHRLAMLKLALNREPTIENVKICLEEIKKDSPSYTVDTITTLRQKYPKAAITFILGFDMFLTLDTWHNYHELLNLCNLLVLKRPNYNKPLSKPIKSLLENHQAQNHNLLKTTPHGKIYLFDAGQYKISSTKTWL